MVTVSLKIQPLGDRVVVKPLGRESVTKSGIVLPDTAKEKPQEGEILAVGPGKVLDNGKRTTLGLHGSRAAEVPWNAAGGVTRSPAPRSRHDWSHGLQLRASIAADEKGRQMLLLEPDNSRTSG